MNYNHPVSSLTDAAQHMAGMKRFLQIGQFTGISLLADGRPALKRDVGIQLC